MSEEKGKKRVPVSPPPPRTKKDGKRAKEEGEDRMDAEEVNATEETSAAEAAAAEAKAAEEAAAAAAEKKATEEQAASEAKAAEDAAAAAAAAAAEKKAAEEAAAAAAEKKATEEQAASEAKAAEDAAAAAAMEGTSDTEVVDEIAFDPYTQLREIVEQFQQPPPPRTEAARGRAEKELGAILNTKVDLGDWDHPHANLLSNKKAYNKQFYKNNKVICNAWVTATAAPATATAATATASIAATAANAAEEEEEEEEGEGLEFLTILEGLFKFLPMTYYKAFGTAHDFHNKPNANRYMNLDYDVWLARYGVDCEDYLHDIFGYYSPPEITTTHTPSLVARYSKDQKKLYEWIQDQRGWGKLYNHVPETVTLKRNKVSVGGLGAITANIKLIQGSLPAKFLEKTTIVTDVHDAAMREAVLMARLQDILVQCGDTKALEFLLREYPSQDRTKTNELEHWIKGVGWDDACGEGFGEIVKKIHWIQNLGPQAEIDAASVSIPAFTGDWKMAGLKMFDIGGIVLLDQDLYQLQLEYNEVGARGLYDQWLAVRNDAAFKKGVSPPPSPPEKNINLYLGLCLFRTVLVM